LKKELYGLVVLMVPWMGKAKTCCFKKATAILNYALFLVNLHPFFSKLRFSKWPPLSNCANATWVPDFSRLWFLFTLKAPDFWRNFSI